METQQHTGFKGETESTRLEALADENRVLRMHLHKLRKAAGHNDQLRRSSAERELELLRAGSLPQLFALLMGGLRDWYQLDAVGLTLHDPQHQVRHLLARDGANAALISAVRFLDFAAGIPATLATVKLPWLGPFVAAEHAALFAREARIASVAILPLRRRNQLDGILAFGSADHARFLPEFASDFLAHLGIIVAICIENAVNRSRLLHAGVTDFLTGWHNRRYLQSRLVEELARAQRSTTGVACLMIDVDHFKRINDRYGHLSGDVLLQEVARRIAAHVRSSDTAARFGGDEFAIVLPGAQQSDAERLAQRILQGVSRAPVSLPGGAEESVTLSLGVASLTPPRDARDYLVLCERLLQEADAALYRAKQAGRNRVTVAVPAPPTH
jgi:two-component system, cell cycle response regulator